MMSTQRHGLKSYFKWWVAAWVTMWLMAGATLSAAEEVKVSNYQPPAEIGVSQNKAPEAPITQIVAKAQNLSQGSLAANSAQAPAAAGSQSAAQGMSAEELIVLNQVGIRLPGVTDNPAVSWGRGGDLRVQPQAERDQPTDAAQAATDNSAQPEPRQPKPPAQFIPADQLKLNQPVVDPTGFLGADAAAQLDQAIRDLYRGGLVQIGLVVVPTTGEFDTFDYGLPIATRWQLGSSEKDNGLLILLSYQDRKVFVFTGYGVEGALPDVALSRIIREDMTPQFAQGDYFAGLSAGIQRMVARLKTDPALLKQQDQQLEQEQTQSNLTLIFGVLALLVGAISAIKLGRAGGGAAASGVFGLLGAVAGLSLAQLILGALLVFAVTLIGFLQLLSLFAQGTGGSGGGFGGSGGGSFGGGGFSGGGGGFGGGGAGGSW